jgi:hypothetical protein
VTALPMGNIPAMVPECTPFRRAVAWGLDAVTFAADFGLPTLEPSQEAVLRDDAPYVILTCSRQWGKSSIVSCIAGAGRRFSQRLALGQPSEVAGLVAARRESRHERLSAPRAAQHRGCLASQ